MWNRQFIELESRLLAVSGWGKRVMEWGKWEETASGYRICFRGNENILKLHFGDGAPSYEYTKKHLIAYFFYRSVVWHLNYISNKLFFYNA